MSGIIGEYSQNGCSLICGKCLIRALRDTLLPKLLYSGQPPEFGRKARWQWLHPRFVSTLLSSLCDERENDQSKPARAVQASGDQVRHRFPDHRSDHRSRQNQSWRSLPNLHTISKLCALLGLDSCLIATPFRAAPIHVNYE